VGGVAQRLGQCLCRADPEAQCPHQADALASGWERSCSCRGQGQLGSEPLLDEFPALPQNREHGDQQAPLRCQVFPPRATRLSRWRVTFPLPFPNSTVVPSPPAAL
jgi:hypothetical protein